MWLRVGCDLLFEIEVPTPFILMLRPRSGAEQWIARDEFKIKPNVPVVEFTDNYGNLCQQLIAPAGNFSIQTKSDVKTSEWVDVEPGAYFVEIQNLPHSVLSYLLPSRYCESDRFCDLASNITANQLPGYDQVAAIETWLINTISYIPGSSDYPISAIEVNNRQSGVCRDLAHLGIALCRSLSIPARMVVGYLYTFDATQTGQKGGYVAIGYGQDAADVAVFNQFGPSVYPTIQNVSVELIEDGF